MPKAYAIVRVTKFQVLGNQQSHSPQQSLGRNRKGLCQLCCIFHCGNKSFIAPHLASVKQCLTFSSDVPCVSPGLQQQCAGVRQNKNVSQLDCVKWKVLPRMFPNKTLFPQILLLNPTLAAVSCPNAAPKVLILIIDTYQNIAEIMCIASPNLSPPAIPALLFLD